MGNNNVLSTKMMNASTLLFQPSTHMVGLSTNSCFFLIFVHGPGSLVPSNTAAHHRELCWPNDPYGTWATLSTTLGLEGVPSLVMNLYRILQSKKLVKRFSPK
jgi:hypothetical protein